MKQLNLLLAMIGLAALMAAPLVASQYMMHLLIQILLLAFIYTAWSMMGRFGFVSFGHGAFMGVGAYVPALMWNYWGVTPWLGIPAGIALSVLLAFIIGYPCFRLRVVGHYFALVTLALSQVVLLTITAARDITGGSLGMTQNTVGFSWYALHPTPWDPQEYTLLDRQNRPNQTYEALVTWAQRAEGGAGE